MYPIFPAQKDVSISRSVPAAAAVAVTVAVEFDGRLRRTVGRANHHDGQPHARIRQSRVDRLSGTTLKTAWQIVNSREFSSKKRRISLPCPSI